MLRKEDAIRLQHMMDAAREAVGFTANRKRDDLDDDKQLALSLVRSLEIIGEAASKVSPQLRAQYSEVCWNDMVGMRNRLIHAYFDINMTIVWRTIKEELPLLISDLEAILANGK